MTNKLKYSCTAELKLVHTENSSDFCNTPTKRQKQSGCSTEEEEEEEIYSFVTVYF